VIMSVACLTLISEVCLHEKKGECSGIVQWQDGGL
jgi:hypothetical protein